MDIRPHIFVNWDPTFQKAPNILKLMCLFVHCSSFAMPGFDSDALSKLQAVLRGRRTRNGAYKRAKEGATILCPFLASPPSVLQAVLSLTNATTSTDTHTDLNKLNSSSVFYDLGCGDGTVLIGIAKATGAKCIGVEIDETLCLTAQRKAAEAGVGDHVEVRQGDLATFSLRDEATASQPIVIFAFLVPSCLDVLSQSIFKHLASGTVLLLYKFPLHVKHGWVIQREVVVADAVKMGAEAIVFMYIVP